MALYIRASTASDANTGTQQKLVLDGLTYQPSTYYYLTLFNETTGASVSAKVNGGGSSGAYFSTAFTFSVNYNTVNRYRAEAKYQSANALTTVYVNYTSPPAPVPTNPPSTPSIGMVSASGKTITLRAYISSDTTYVDWDDTRWAGGSYKRSSVSGVTYVDKTFTVPNYGVTYQWDAVAGNSYGTSNWSSIYSWTPVQDPNAIPPTPTITKVSQVGKSIKFRASGLSNTSKLDWSFNWNGGTRVNQTISVDDTYADLTMEVPAYNTPYNAQVQAYSPTNKFSSWSNLLSFNSGADVSPPAVINLSITGMGGQSFFANFSGGQGTSTIVLEVREGSASGSMAWANSNIAVGTAQVSVSGLKEFTNYHVKVFGRNANGDGVPTTMMVQTLDKTAPYITITDHSGVGKMWFDFNGYDVNASVGGSSSGLDYYRVWISPRNSSSLTMGVDILNTALSYYTFETDADGLNFAHGSTYTLGVKSVDVSGNWSELVTRTVTYTKARPNNWNWITAKTAGNVATATAVEWESLGKAINQFRTYKSLVVRDFTVPVSGDVITATIFNQYCNGIRDMSPPTDPPLNKVSGEAMYALSFRTLTDSLNSII